MKIFACDLYCQGTFKEITLTKTFHSNTSTKQCCKTVLHLYIIVWTILKVGYRMCYT